MKAFSESTEVPEALARSGGHGNRQTGERWKSMLVRHGLKPAHHMLDVGCGLGRTAVALEGYLTGRYEGFDVDAAAIAWCREHIRTPGFAFQVADLRNARYNPAGASDAESFVFPYPARTFDFAIAASVFTHVQPAVVRRYLRELKRVLKPGGTCVCSFFLMNARVQAGIAGGTIARRYHFPHKLGECRVQNANVPEQAVAHPEALVRTWYSARGLKVEKVRYGRWSVPDGAGWNQDLVFARRPPVELAPQLA